LERSNVKMQVIILVRDAIYTADLLFDAAITLWLFNRVFRVYAVSGLSSRFRLLNLRNNLLFLASAS
jgi:hypothetical protein